MQVDIEKNFTGFRCQVQANENSAVEMREGAVALAVETMPDGQPIVMLAIEHANGTSNVAVLDQSSFMRLALMMKNASHEAAQLALRAAGMTVQ